ncbi:MAG: hypothetical protein B7Z66_01065 [Chromatiales bacterium 21-64-14]|nr:MAG: hypothetical protein B7Z66_01065 [Chromatiales bacterium 21-64-14]HQU16038.1 TRAP transporter substrate-binding protein DctP [Gammaproteobacteria bacterium]
MSRLAWLIVGLSIWSSAVAQEPYVLKFATLAPRGSSWMNVLSTWADTVRAKSDGRLIVKLYPGGVAGDESDVLLKMRFGQIQGAAFTGHGIGEIYFPARVMEIPFLFRSYDEIDYVRARLMPEFRAGFRRNGFELVGWAEVGPVRLFSKYPIRSFDDMKNLRIWLWQGDPLAQAFFSASGLSPIPLSITEVYTSLSTGLINTVYAPALGAIAMQWFTKTQYVTDFPMADAIGALVVQRQFFDRLPADLQALLLQTGGIAGRELIKVSRTDNRKSLQVLRKYGLKFVLPWKQVNHQQFYTLRDRVVQLLEKRGLLPVALVDQVQADLSRYRARHKTTGQDPNGGFGISSAVTSPAR